MKQILLFTVFVFVSKIIMGQFNTTYNDTILPFGSGAYTFDGICQDDTFIYILGGVNNYEQNWQLMIIKIDDNGNILKKRKIVDTLIYYASYPYNSIVQKNNKLLIISQIVDTLSVVKGCIIAIDKNSLDTLWTRIYPHPDTASILSSSDKFSDLTAIKATPDNCYILCGNYMSAGNERSYLMKIDSVGNTLWTKTYSDVSNLYCLELAPNNGFAVINRYGGTNFMLIDSVGNIVWRKKANNYIGNGTSGDLKYVGNNNFIVTTAFMYNTDVNNPLMGTNVYKINISNKQILWDKTYILYEDFIGITLHQAMGVETLSDGSIIISGTVQKDGGRKGVILKLNSNGDSLWTKNYDFGTHFNNNDRCQLNDLLVCNDGGFFGVGFFWDKNSNDAAWMFKTDSNGVVGFESSISMDRVLKVYPNPVKDFLNIELTETSFQELELRIINSLGQTILLENIAKNQKEIIVKIGDIIQGIYFFEIRKKDEIIGCGKFIKE